MHLFFNILATVITGFRNLTFQLTGKELVILLNMSAYEWMFAVAALHAPPAVIFIVGAHASVITEFIIWLMIFCRE